MNGSFPGGCALFPPMRLTFPLSLKVTLWLLLNLALLGAVGLGFLVVPGGAGWSTLVDGAAGGHLQLLADAAVTEAARAENAAERDAIFARFIASQGADIFLFHNDGRQLAGPRVEL